MHKYFIVTIVVVLASVQVHALCEASGTGKCYYVDPVNGNDANSGMSEAAAWQSFKNVISYYKSSYRPAGWVQVKPGDYIYLMDGVHSIITRPGDAGGQNGGPAQIIYFRSVSNPAANPAYIKEYPGANAVVGEIGGGGIYMLQSSGFVISGMEIRNTGGHGIQFDAIQDTTIDGIYLHDTSRNIGTCCNPSGFKINSAKNIIIRNSVFHDNFEYPAVTVVRGSAIIIFGGQTLGGDIEIYNNTFYQTKPVLDANNQSLGFGDCVFNKHANNDPSATLKIYNNVFRNCKNAWFGGQHNTHFHHNIVDGASGQSVKFLDAAGQTHLLNELVEYNTFYNSGQWVVEPAPLYHTSALFPLQNKNITFRNNIFYRNGAQVTNIGQYMNDSDYNDLLPELHLDNNCYYSPNGPPTFGFGSANGGNYGVLGKVFSLSEWQSPPFKDDINSIAANPMFVDAANGNFQLQSASPCNAMGAFASGGNPPPTAACGNGVKEGTEQCDLGNANGACPNTCSAACTNNNCAPTKPGANLAQPTNVVDINDVIVVVQNMGQSGATDLNGDGTTNLYDLIILAQNWG